MPFSGAVGIHAYAKDARLPLAVEMDGTLQTGFIRKYASNGDALWSVRIVPSGGSTNVYGTATDSAGAVYAACILTAGPWATLYNADGAYGGTFLNTSGTGTGAALVKYNANGVYQWTAFVASTNGATWGYAVTLDPSDNVYMTGETGAWSAVVRAYNADGTAFGTSFTMPADTNTSADAFLVRYSSNGVVSWLARVSSPTGLTDDAGRGLVADSTGVYMTGQTGAGVTTAYNANGTAFGTTFTTTPYGTSGRQGSTAVVIKYTPTGSVAWLTRIEASETVASAAALDLSGNLLVAGFMLSNRFNYGNPVYNANGTVFSNVSATRSVVLVKYSTSGTAQWVATATHGICNVAPAIVVDSMNNAYIVNQKGSGGAVTFNSANGTSVTQTSAVIPGQAFLAKFSVSGLFQWAAGFDGGTRASENAYALTRDSANNIYAAVYTNGTPPYSATVYNSGGSVFSTVNLTTTLATCLMKYDSNGTALAAVAFNSSTTPFALSSDSSANLFLGGNTTEPRTRNQRPSGTVAMTLSNGGLVDAMIVKYTTNGAPMWATRIASTGNDAAYAVTTDSEANIYVTGLAGNNVTASTVYNADGTAFATTIPVARGFLVKYSLAGVVQWVASFTGGGYWPGPAGGEGLVTDSTGSVYVATMVRGGGTLDAYNADGSLGISQTTTFPTNGSLGAVYKYSSTGTAQWIARVATTTSGGSAFSAITCGPDDAIYAVGSCRSGSTAFNADGTSFGAIANAGLADAIVVKYNTAGTVQWIARIGSATSVGAGGVACDSSGNVYVCGGGGSATQTVTIFNANGTTFSTLPVTTGLADGFVVKYNSSGTAQWAARFGGVDSDGPTSLATDSIGDVYISGTTGTTASGGSTAQVTFRNADGTAFPRTLANSVNIGFLVKYSSVGRVQWVVRLDGQNDQNSDYALAAATDRRGNVYTGGLINRYDTGGGIADTGSVISSTGNPFSLVKLTSYGQVQWFQSIKPLNATSGMVFPTTYGIALDFDCNPIVVGTSSSNTTTNIFAKA
jgi:hypothetical protein